MNTPSLMLRPQPAHGRRSPWAGSRSIDGQSNGKVAFIGKRVEVRTSTSIVPLKVIL